MTLSITPVSANKIPTYSNNSKTGTLCLNYECSAQRKYVVWLLTESINQENDYQLVFHDLERSSRRENKQPLLIDLRGQRFFYRLSSDNNEYYANASGRVTSRSFSREVLCVQLAHYLLTEMRTYPTNDYYTTSLASNLTACLIKQLDQKAESTVGITPYHLKQVENYIQSHMDNPVTLDDLARVVKLSPFHFTRQFKQTTGETPYQYVVRLKMQHAKYQLLTTEASVINIGMQIGYESPSNFSRAFKRTMGVSPSRLRKTLQEEFVKLSA